MKRILYLLVVLVSACSTPPMTPAQQNVAPISNTNNCRFITTAYFEVSHPSRMHYYAAKNTANAGGDSYKILTSGEDYSGRSIGLIAPINTTNIAIYRCR